MTSLKTKNICFLAAFLFLSIVPTLAEVVDRVQDCNQFLYRRIPPNIQYMAQNIPNRYRFICQTYKDVPRYLTLYDTVNKIPVFSAYKYRGSVPGRCDDGWMIEPQLENGANQNDVDMMKQDRNINYNRQAVNGDYGNNQGYDRGHLFPANHASTYEDQLSTFTLTNAVPQAENFNRGRWKTMEDTIKTTMDVLLTNQFRCFVVVGAQPSNNNNPNGVNIPSMMWSAFYCSDREGHTESRAYWSNNNNQDTVHEETLQNIRNGGIDPFPGAP